jgi:hypothetical protein
MDRQSDGEMLQLAARLVAQVEGEAAPAWPPGEWEANTLRLLALINSEESPRRLGDLLRLDIGLDLPIEAVKAAYERLLHLGVNDARTRLCYARYLLLHGPQRDRPAHLILDEVEAPARAAGLWDSPVLGHHPVFFADP